MMRLRRSNATKVELKCDYCGDLFVMTEDREKKRRKQSKSGKLYCSQRCFADSKKKV